jgi:hypothetical protein
MSEAVTHVRACSPNGDPIDMLISNPPLRTTSSVWDPEPAKERVGDWGGPATVWSLLCVAEMRATRPNGWRVGV